MTQKTTSQALRVRFAPSPTGYLHIGGLRAALFNWLFARHNNGVFLLRIEDTDIERSKPEYTQAILDAFAWVDIQSDEPIVIQSTRIKRHQEVAQQLLESGKAYKCYCTPDELKARLGAIEVEGESYTRYDELCRKNPQACDRPYAIRFAVSSDRQTISYHDLIRGEISFDRDQFDDFIIVRSDGTPMYNFVVVVDDADMAISHVLRGEDHISNTPKQILLYEACGFNKPQFGHLPMILGADGSRLSKRHAATSVQEYKKAGFLPDALCNYLVRLGWSHGDQEIFTRQELINLFSLDHVGKKGAIFDIVKLEWVNGMFLRSMSDEQVYAYITKELDPAFDKKLSNWSHERIMTAIHLYKERVKTIKELIEEITILYDGPKTVCETEMAPWSTKEVQDNLLALMHELEKTTDFRHDHVAVVIKTWCQSRGVKLPDIAKPIRIALTGKTSSPGVFELLEVVGAGESISRMKQLVDCISRRVEMKA